MGISNDARIELARELIASGQHDAAASVLSKVTSEPEPAKGEPAKTEPARSTPAGLRAVSDSAFGLDDETRRDGEVVLAGLRRAGIVSNDAPEAA